MSESPTHICSVSRESVKMGGVMLYLVLAMLPAMVLTSRELEKTRQQARYHLKMLDKKISLIKRSLSPGNEDHRISKRSTEGMEADELILNSLSSYCSSFQSDANIKELFKKRYDRQHLSSRDITGYKGFKPKHQNDFNMKLNAFPTKVLKEGIDVGQVWLIFYIAHSEDVKLSMLDPYDFLEAEMKIPESSCQTIESKARFFVNVSYEVCRQDQDDTVGTGFRINSGENTLMLYFNPCRFVAYDTLYSIIDEGSHIPRFDMASDEGRDQSFVVIKKESLPKIIFEFKIVYRSEQEINLVLWDWTQNKTVYYSATIEKQYGKDSYIKYNQADNLSFKEYVNDYNSKSNLEEEDKPFNATISQILCRGQSSMGYGSCIRVEVTVNSSLHRPRTGQLSATYSLKRSKSYGEGEPIIGKYSLKRTMQIRLPNRAEVFPDERVVFSPKQRYFCNEYGDMADRYANLGKNCTVRCQAFGKGITSIYITKQGVLNHYARPGSYILEDEAAAVLNVGPSSRDVEGVYKCVVVDKNARTKAKDLNLYTSLFTKVNSLEMSGDNNEMTNVTCRVEGGSDVRVAIFVVDKEEEVKIRLDEKYKAIITQENADEYTMNITIPWTALKHPLKKLICYAQGVRGRDEQFKRLNNYKQNTLGIWPILRYSEFEVETLSNGSLSVNCTAWGLQPMKISILYFKDTYGTQLQYEFHQHVNKSLDVDNKPKATFTSIIPTTTREGTLLCVAKNEYFTNSQRYHERFGRRYI